MEGKPMFSLHKTRGGVHPPQCKDMRDFACTSIASPDKVLIPLNMHIGAPASPVVSEGDHVYVGTLIGQVEGLGSPIHASISGTVTKVATEQLPTGATAPVVEIASDGKMEADPALKAPEYATKEEFISCVRDSGMVGLGGASFPTWFKMRAPQGKSFEFLVVNGMECEPYITSDYRQMMEHTERVVDGVFRTIEALEIPFAVIGVEDNKPEAILELQRVVKEKGREDRIDEPAADQGGAHQSEQGAGERHPEHLDPAHLVRHAEHPQAGDGEGEPSGDHRAGRHDDLRDVRLVEARAAERPKEHEGGDRGEDGRPGQGAHLEGGVDR